MKKKTPPATEQFNALMKLPKIEPHHLLVLPPRQQILFRKLLAEKLAATKGEERDAFLQKISALLEPDKIWEYNQCRITKAIQEHIHLYACMPSKSSIAEATGLSRQTVYNHLRNFSPTNNPHASMFPVMRQQILTRLIDIAMLGDVAAAKAYLLATDKETQTGTTDIVIKNQNNYIQINGTVLSQDALQHLKPGQLQQIERIIKKAGIKSLPPSK